MRLPRLLAAIVALSLAPQAWAAPAIHAGFPLSQASHTGTTRTLSVTTSSASLLVAIVGSGGASVTSVAGGGLTWTRRAQVLMAEIWTAPSSGALSSQNITATFSGVDNSMILYAITGADSTSLANVLTYSGASGAMQRSFTSQAAGSMLLWGITDYISGATTSAATGNTKDAQVADTNGEDYTGGHYTTLPAAGTYTLGATNTSTGWRLIAIELRAAAGGPATYDESFTEAVTVGDSLATSATFPNALSEDATAGDSLASQAIFNNESGRSYSDDFNRADGAPGGGWTQGAFTDVALISGNRLVPNGAGAAALWGATELGDDYEVEAEFVSTSSNARLVLRGNSGADLVSLRIAVSGGATWQFAGSNGLLGVSRPVTTDKWWRIRVQGLYFTHFSSPDGSPGSWTYRGTAFAVNPVATGGKPGFYWPASSPDYLMDNFSVRVIDAGFEPGETVVSTFIAPNSFSEGITLEDALADMLTCSNAFTEAITTGDSVVDDFLAGGVHVYNESFTEALNLGGGPCPPATSGTIRGGGTLRGGTP